MDDVVAAKDQIKKDESVLINWFSETAKKISRNFLFLLIIPIINIYFIYINPTISNFHIKNIQNIDQTIYQLSKKSGQLYQIYHVISERNGPHVLEINGFQNKYVNPLNEKFSKNEDYQILAKSISAISDLVDQRMRYYEELPFENSVNINLVNSSNEQTAVSLFDRLKLAKNENDPIYNLEKLSTLDSAIINLILFHKKKADNIFINYLRQQNNELITDGLLSELSTYTLFEKYPLIDNQKIEYFSSYKEIVSIINPPFNVRTLQDLLTLKDYLLKNFGESLNKNNNQMRIETPYFKANIELFYFLILSPLFCWILILFNQLHSKRINKIYDKWNSEKNQFIGDLHKYSANMIFYFGTSLNKISTKKYWLHLIAFLMWLYIFSSTMVLLYQLLYNTISNSGAFLFYGIYLNTYKDMFAISIFVIFAVKALVSAYTFIFKTIKVLFAINQGDQNANYI